MPYIHIATNVHVGEEKLHELCARVSSLCAETLGKGEQWVMARISSDEVMTYAGTAEPCAYVELKSVGLGVEQCGTLSNVLCGFLDSTLHVAPERIYIEFNPLDRKWFGWNGKTLG